VQGKGSMRAVIQRVLRASVHVDGELVSEIGKGLCVLVGITHTDSADDVDYVVRKILGQRLWGNDEGAGWRTNVVDGNFEVLGVSQFTLYAMTKKGNKPDFHLAMPGEESEVMYNQVLDKLRAGFGQRPEAVKNGKFGAEMEVGIVNDGPVTIIIDSVQKDPALHDDKSATKAGGGDAAELSAARQEELRAHLAAHKAGAPPKVKGKPTPEQIAAMQAHAATLKEWKASLTEGERSFVNAGGDVAAKGKKGKKPKAKAPATADPTAEATASQPSPAE